MIDAGFARPVLGRAFARHSLSISTALGGPLALALMALPGMATAQNQCGAPPAGGGTVTCTDDNNPYPTGIAYTTVEDLTIVVEPDVVVNSGALDSIRLLGNGPTGVNGVVNVADGATLTSLDDGIFAVTQAGGESITIDNGASISAGTRGILAASTGDTLVTNRGAIVVDGTLNVSNQTSGIVTVSSTGAIEVTNSGPITITGADFFSNGIIAQTSAPGATIDIDNSGDIAITTTGANGFSNAIFAGGYANGAGSTTITNSGDLTVSAANTARGIAAFVYSNDGVTIGNSGAITVTGANAHGILVSNQNAVVPNDVSIVSSGDISATSTVGGFAAGVRATASGALAIDLANVTAAGNATQGIVGVADGGVTVSADDVSTTGDNSNAVDLTSLSGPIDLTVGDVTTAGALSGGVRAIGGTDSNVTVTTGKVTTTGTAGSNYAFLPNSTAIVATAQGTGNVAVTAGNLVTAGLGARGVSANAAAGNVTVATGSVITTGDRASGIGASSYGGDVSVTTSGAIATSGDTSFGVYAVARDGAVTANAQAVTTTGFNADGIGAIAGAGGADVRFTDVTTSGTFADGVTAYATGGPVTINGANATINGDVANAIVGFSDTGNVAVTTTGTVAATGRGSAGIYAISNTGAANVTANNVRVIAADDADAATTRAGIFASGGSANVIVTGTAATGGSALYGGTADAITAIASTGDASVTVNNASTTGDNADAVDASSAAGMTRVIATGALTTTGANSRGIYARGATGTTVSGGGDVSTTGDNANAVDVASATGPVSVTLDAISTSGALSGGVRAIGGTNGNVTVTTGNVTTTGTAGSNYSFLPNSTAIVATAQGTGNVAVTAGNIATAGLGAAGVNAAADRGNVSVVTGGVATTGGRANGVTAQSNAGNVVVSTGTVSTLGDSSAGVYAVARGGGVTVDALAINTSGFAARGINAIGAAGGVDVGFTSINTSGTFSSGISAIATGGPVVVSGANIAASGQSTYALYASSDTGNVAVTTTGTVASTGRGGTGIFATSGTGAVTVNATNVSTVATNMADTATSRGAIFARGASANVVVTGQVSTAGRALYGGTADAISVTGTAGDASATVNNVTSAGDTARALVVNASRDASATINGAVRTTGAATNAVVVTGGRNATVNIGAGGTIASTGNLVTISSVGTSTVNNAGTLANNPNGFAIQALGGPITINNSGNLTSDIVLTAGADRVDNTGIFTVGPNPDFGAGVDVFANSGTVLVGSGATAVVAPVFTGLETFNNTGGLVDLRNGRAGDTLTLPGTFAGSGNSRLGLDIQFGGTTTSDRLIVGGAATGSTQVLLTPLGGSQPVFNPGTILVQGGPGSTAGAFSLAGGALETGLVRTDIVFNPTDFTFRLSGAPSDAAFRTLNYVEGARNLWLKSADVVSAQLRARRDALSAFGGGAPSARMWLQIHGSVETREGQRDFGTFGQTRLTETGFEQDYFGGQLGFDFGGGSGEDGGFAIGVTGGYINSSQNFAGSADRVEYDAVNAGIYASYSSGTFFLNGLAKYDYYWGDATSQSGAFNQDFKGSSYGARGEVGVRFGGDAFFVEPAASISYVKTDFDDFTVTNTSVNFDDDDGLRGRLGARIGGKFDLGGPVGSFYAGGNYVHEFSGEDNVTFVNNGQSLTFGNRRLRDYGEALVGVSIGQPNGVSGFIEGTYIRSFNKDNGNLGIEGAGGRAGLRIRF